MAVLLIATVEKNEVDALDALISLLCQWKIKDKADVLFMADDGVAEVDGATSTMCAEFRSLEDAEVFKSELGLAGEGFLKFVRFEVLRRLRPHDIDALGTLL